MGSAGVEAMIVSVQGTLFRKLIVFWSQLPLFATPGEGAKA